MTENENKDLHKLTEEEIKQVTGGFVSPVFKRPYACRKCGKDFESENDLCLHRLNCPKR